MYSSICLLQCVAVLCSALQWKVALQQTHVFWHMFVVVLFSTATRRDALHNTATRCNTGLFFIDCRRMSASESDVTHLEATHCNASQHTAILGYFSSIVGRMSAVI